MPYNMGLVGIALARAQSGFFDGTEGLATSAPPHTIYEA
jgi:hypothetical protein